MTPQPLSPHPLSPRKRLAGLSQALLLTLCWPMALAAQPACPGSTDITVQMLTGQWSVQWQEAAPGSRRMALPWTLALEPHPEYAGSLKGRMRRDGTEHLVVADWDDEALTVEESTDGQRIAATWLLQLRAGSCGQVLEGVRFTGDAPPADAPRARWHRLR